MTEQTINIYNKKASIYETRWRSYLEHTHEAFIRNIETTEKDKILDISGGTGLLAEMIIERGYPFQQLIINDPSVQMLNMARNRLSSKSKVSFTNYRAEHIPFEANRLDRIFCLNSFHFYGDQQRVLDQCYFMLKPGGSLYMLDWNRTGFFKTINLMIKWSTSAHIATPSLTEYECMLRESKFNNKKSKIWSWRYWKFFYSEAEKPSF